MEELYGAVPYMDRMQLRKRAIELRRQGLTYAAVAQVLGIRIPKSTFSYWCNDIELPARVKQKLRDVMIFHLERARQLALDANRQKRERYLGQVRVRVQHLPVLLKDRNVAKIALAMLYLGEGRKNMKRGAMMFGNSEPAFVRLFLILLRRCYDIDEKKFRCTLQCRADQNIKKLEKFWSRVTGIPLSQFYKAQIDPRTIGKPSKKLDYKGVCRIDYFSAEIFTELLTVINVISGP